MTEGEICLLRNVLRECEDALSIAEQHGGLGDAGQAFAERLRAMFALADSALPARPVR